MQGAAINKESQDVIEKGERKGEDMQDFDMEVYLQKLLAACKQAFGADLLYMGLQGSWRRGEATEHSDIDVVVVLETFGTEQMRTYRRILEQVGFEERSCGFICGRRELQNWNCWSCASCRTRRRITMAPWPLCCRPTAGMTSGSICCLA